jgi:hypothetical protein
VLLHVTNGDSVAGTLRQTSLGGNVLPWQDALHEGPVRALPRNELLEERAAFLAGCGWGGRQELLDGLEGRDRELLDALANEHAVVLWFEHDLYDQLQLIDVLSLALTVGTTPELIVISSFLGKLTATELETFWPSRSQASPEMLELATDAWDALREPEPTALARLATGHTPGLPFLSPALRRLLEELPSTENGLSGTERRALEAVAAGARTPQEAFVTAQRLEEAPFLGDTWFYRALSALEPLVESNGELRLTQAGEAVLRGEADRVELLGIDRWVGGTHVTPDNLWRWGASSLLRP